MTIEARKDARKYYAEWLHTPGPDSPFEAIAYALERDRAEREDKMTRMEKIITETAEVVDPECPDYGAYVDGHCGLKEALERDRAEIKAKVEAMEDKSYCGYPEATAHIMAWNEALEAVVDLLEELPMTNDARRKEQEIAAEAAIKRDIERQYYEDADKEDAFAAMTIDERSDEFMEGILDDYVEYNRDILLGNHIEKPIRTNDVRLEFERHLTEAVAYALERDRAETRQRLDKWIENSIDKKHRTPTGIEAGLVKLGEAKKPILYLGYLPSSKKWYVVLDDNGIDHECEDADTPGEAVEAAKYIARCTK